MTEQPIEYALKEADLIADRFVKVLPDFIARCDANPNYRLDFPCYDALRGFEILLEMSFDRAGMKRNLFKKSSAGLEGFWIRVTTKDCRLAQ